MATLDQLPPDRRAIIELVLRQGQSYSDLAGMLGMPESRVRTYAREALSSLAPRATERVDSEWLGQVADYVLGQQVGPQAKATRAHIRRSEPARMWALSMLDSLSDLFRAGSEPEIPGADGKTAGRAGRTATAPLAPSTREAKPPAERTRPPRPHPEPTPPKEAERIGEGEAERTREREADLDREGEARRTKAPARAARRLLRPEDDEGRRRRLAAVGAAGVAAVGLVVGLLFLVGILGGGEEEAAPPAADTGEEAGQPPPADAPDVLADFALEPVGGGEGMGEAVIAAEQDQPLLIVRAQLPPTGGNEAYEVWLYNDQEDAVSLGAQVTDQEGNFQGAGPLPDDFEQYRSIDVSLEERDGDPAHSGDSVLRGRIPGLASGGGGSAGDGQ